MALSRNCHQNVKIGDNNDRLAHDVIIALTRSGAIFYNIYDKMPIDQPFMTPNKPIHKILINGHRAIYIQQKTLLYMTTPHSVPDNALLSFAHELANEARRIAQSYFLSSVSIETKDDQSPVTIADRTIEATLRAQIQSQFPTHGVSGEEFDDIHGSSDYCWTIDPIDGTQSFVCGVPLFGSLIALSKGNQPLLGMIDMPMLVERYWAITPPETASELGAKAYQISRQHQDAQIIRSGEGSDISQARVLAAHPDMFDPQQKQRFDRLTNAAMISRYSTDCYAYALLASGRIDLVAEADMKPYDFQALIPIVQAAGGVITDWHNQPLTAASGTTTVLASANKELHEKALQILAD